MSDTKFTKGPWKYDKDIERIHGERFTLVAWCKPHAGNPDVTHANGNLIAAAPEMYASLKEMLEWCIWDTEYAARARKALAKAEGVSTENG